jgi:broad specificity phosphatase PhoE
MLFALAGCAATPRAAALEPNILVIRHLHTPKGATDPDLTSEGHAAAQALAKWLSRNPPRAIFVSDTKRARQTAAPAATRFRVTPIVYDPRDTAALLASVQAQRGTVLIVGHSNTVPDIVAGLGGERPAPLVHEDFGDIWHIQGPERRTNRTKFAKP